MLSHRTIWTATRRGLSLARFLHIKTASTPNDNALKFISTDGELLQDRGKPSVEIKNTDSALIEHSPLAQRIFTQCSGVESMMIGDDFVTINKDEMVHWSQITGDMIDLLTQYLASGKDAVSSQFFSVQEQSVGYDVNLPKFKYDEDQQEISDMIDELIQTRIRPAIMDDGGDIQYRGYDPESGTVYLKLQGACKSCSSSEVTLKHGIESMLKHYIDEVENVVQILDPEEQIALKEFEKLEQKLDQK
ncbi:LANO_0D04588g1_1 [Lachancea nothofagi CBS 11611]|uniref:LANO_0D04588g1_1 n=1 Tax=Lachancea nothofagi CBS 11611 TaxID=1266666 RepID=A0A1G4JGB1_9SACH|nr:LANO_0D04588g1_1 [Lachancea nothofagi CBS 11611]